MGLGDISGIFSRFFVVGFFLPSFFTLFALHLIFEGKPEGSDVFVIGGVALLIALVLLGFRNVIWFNVFSGYWGKERHMIGGPGPVDSAADERRDLPLRQRMMQWNRFRWKTLLYRRFVMREYGLDTWIAWPFIEANLSPREQELHTDALSNVHFFQNMCLGALTVAVALIVAAFVEPVGGVAGSIAVAAGCVVLTYLFYRGAVGAVALWGENKIVAAVTHRQTLYTLMGYKMPASTEEELAIGKDASRILAGDKHWPEPHLRRRAE